MVEHKKALKIKITMQSPKTPAVQGPKAKTPGKASEVQNAHPRLLLPALLGLAMGVGAVLVWWGFTGARQAGPAIEVTDAPLASEQPVAPRPSPIADAPTPKARSVTPLSGKALFERLPEPGSPSAGAEAEPLSRAALAQAASSPSQAAPTAEEIVASDERGSTAPVEAQSQRETRDRADGSHPRPSIEQLAALAPMLSSDTTTPFTNGSTHVAQALFTSAIKGGQPTDREGPVVFPRGKSGKSLYFFTELRGLKGKTVTHRWEYQGETTLTIPFKIGSNRWRVYSNKNLPTKMTGTWRVVVADPSGAVLAAKEFDYQKR